MTNYTCKVTSTPNTATYYIASFPGAEEGKEKAPGTHCLRIRVIIAKATWYMVVGDMY